MKEIKSDWIVISEREICQCLVQCFVAASHMTFYLFITFFFFFTVVTIVLKRSAVNFDFHFPATSNI